MNDNLTINDVYDDGVKEIYVFSKNNTPKSILDKIGSQDRYTALAVYRYSDGSWMNALLLYDQLYDDFEDTCDAIYELYKDVIKKKGISFVRDCNGLNSRMFIPENYHKYLFD